LRRALSTLKYGRRAVNPQERTVLESFLDQLVRVHGIDKDPEADAMIKRAVAQQPDAAYLVVQKSLLLMQALDQAKARIADLERASGASGRGFLDPGASNWSAGSPQASSASVAPGRPAAGPAGQPSQSYGPQYAGPPYGAPAASPVPPAASGAPSFLGQAAATAAGVAGGAFLFEGLEGLFGHHGSSGPGWGAGSTFPTEDVTVNNYYASNDRSDEIGDDQETDDADPQADSDYDPTDDGDDSDSVDDSGDFV
jgi:uncharacterized protein